MKRVDGYPTDVNYPAFFYREMQPVWLAQLTTWQGIQAPNPMGHFRLCELGCGIGINVLVAAASHPQAEFVGVDVNERHLHIARNAAMAAGLSNVQFIHSDFYAFSQQLAVAPATFDFITCHGVWSWVGGQQQRALLDCVQQGLKSGGLFYLHYMCHPGSTDLQELQHFLKVFAPHVPGTSAQQVQMGLKLLAQLAEHGLFHERPGVQRHLRNLLTKNVNHLAHEFLTEHWQPQQATDVHSQLGQAGLNYVGSADVFNNLDVSLSIPKHMQTVLRKTQIPEVAETLKDMARGSHQRMDVFLRDPQPLTAKAYQYGLNHAEFVRLPGAPESGALTFTTPIGLIEGAEALCSPVLQRLAQGKASFAQLQQLPAFENEPSVLLNTLQLMMMQGVLHPVYCGEQAPIAVATLQHWLQEHQVALRLIPTCGTGVIVER